MAIEGDKNFVIEEPAEARRKYGVPDGAVCLRLIGFRTGHPELRPEHEEALRRNVIKLLGPDAALYIVGHASLVGDAGFNQRLSDKRALAVFEYVKFRVDLSRARVEHHGKGETQPLGATDNDPKDRAVVVVVQEASAPRPRFLPPDLPGRVIVIPDTPPLGPPPAGFRRAGWKVDSVSNVQLGVPIPQTGGIVSIGGSMHWITLRRIASGETADYQGLLGLVSAGIPKIPGGSGIAKVLTSVLEKIQKLFKVAPGFGPGSWPTQGSEILVTPWVPEPITADEFACKVFIMSLSASVGANVSGSLIVWSKIGFGFTPLEQAAWIATIKGAAVFQGFGLGLPGASADALMGGMLKK